MLDIFTNQIWKNLEREIPDRFSQYQGKLKRLCLAARAPLTARTYGYAFQRWKKWAISYQLCICRANPVYVAVFLTSILESMGPHHSAQTVMYAIDWAHKVAGLEPPSNQPLVKSIVDAGHRVYGKPVVKKEPITSDLLLRLVSSYSYTRKLTLYSS